MDPKLYDYLNFANRLADEAGIISMDYWRTSLKVHDYMALVNVIEGSGGKVTDKFGNEITTDSRGSCIASANEKLHSELISLINEEK